MNWSKNCILSGIDLFWGDVHHLYATAIVLLLGTWVSQKLQAQNMAPEDPCIATQIEMVGDISPGDTVCFKLCGTHFAGLQISDDNEIRLRKLQNGQYVSWPIAVVGQPWDTLVIIGVGQVGESQTISYTNPDCVPPTGQIGLVLPITLVSFKARVEEDSLVFEWVTAQESNVEQYEGQVADANATKFKTVVSKPAEWNNQDLKTHRMKVDLRTAGLQPWQKYIARLESKDLDGSTQFSPLVSFKVNADGFPYDVELVPNPVTSSSKLTLKNIDPTSISTLYLASVNGTIYPCDTKDLPEIDLSKYHLPGGVYAVLGYDADRQQVVNEKLLIINKAQ